ncbi:DgyrCDS8407 [Dimorphilus gyrociliatus]|uniref:DgyrCDS8407 n=1 Tax=Dimorphilus gyrociliatus TaxID=2664684 RepID=A0A7I8VZ65_9ANNE|nr:DgyrCDS8407 [Dimorphilus gyrociliatus]
METKKGRKRAKQTAEETWECTMCTFENPSESFACQMCETKKGTSTRKPASVGISQEFSVASTKAKRRRPKSVEKPQITTSPAGYNSISPSPSAEVPNTDRSYEVEENAPEPEPEQEQEPPEPTTQSCLFKRNFSFQKNPRTKSKRPPKHKNVIRSTAVRTKITVNGVTVMFIDYQPKKTDTTNVSISDDKVDHLSDAENSKS